MGELLRDLENPTLISQELEKMGHSMGLRCMEEFLAKATLLISDRDASTTAAPEGSASSASSSQNSTAIANLITTTNFEETPEVVKMVLKMFFGITADSRWKQETTTQAATTGSKEAETGVTSSSSSSSVSYSLLFTDNPLTLFVELPEEWNTAAATGDPMDTNGTLEYNALLIGWCKGVLELLQMECHVTMPQSILKGDPINEIHVQLQQVTSSNILGDEYQEE